MNHFLSISILICCLLFSSLAMAFDNKVVINRPSFNNENFLDINSVSFRDDQDEQWRQSHNGWRMTGHSLSGDLLYTQGELKLRHGLSETFNFYFNMEMEDFYSEIPAEDPMLEMEYFPFDYPVSVSFVSTTAYRKAEVDMGFAVTLGERTGDFLRLERVTVDKLFNSKKSDSAIDDATYEQFQTLSRLKAFYNLNNRVSFMLDWQDASEMVFHADDLITTFRNSGYQYSAFMKYRWSAEDAIKIAVRGFEINKALARTATNQQQQLNYESVNLKWLTRQQQKNKISLGLRYDRFTNKTVDALNSANDIDYSFRTTQVYATWLYPYNDTSAFDFGLYVGQVVEPYDPDWIPSDINKENIQSQLRLSWVNASSGNMGKVGKMDKKSSLQVHLSINLDDILNDPGDGYGMTYQYVF